MEKFNFYQDRKVTCWERTHFDVKAESYEEAVAIVKSWQGEDVLCFEDDENIIITDGETLYDTSESLSVEENGGQPTIEVFADNGEDIINNKHDNTEQRSEEHTSELQSRQYLVCRLLLEKKNK